MSRMVTAKLVYEKGETTVDIPLTVHLRVMCGLDGNKDPI